MTESQLLRAAAHKLLARADELDKIERLEPEKYRYPEDNEEAVLALRAGVLERDMTGIPYGEQGWHPCGLSVNAVRRGLGKFRVPKDWRSNGI